MKTEKAASVESLRRLWLQIALLRQEVEQAERDQEASQLQLRLESTIEVAQVRHQSR